MSFKGVNEARAKRPPPEPPPSIGDLRAQGVTRFRVSCNEVNCGHGADLILDMLGLPEDTPFPSVARWRRWKMLALRIAEGQSVGRVTLAILTNHRAFFMSRRFLLFGKSPQISP